MQLFSLVVQLDGNMVSAAFFIKANMPGWAFASEIIEVVEVAVIAHKRLKKNSEPLWWTGYYGNTKYTQMYPQGTQ